jgi:hypothetical protein
MLANVLQVCIVQSGTLVVLSFELLAYLGADVLASFELLAYLGADVLAALLVAFSSCHHAHAE